MKIHYLLCLVALNACKLSNNNSLVKADSEDKFEACYDDSSLVYKNQYNKGEEWDLYESLTYVKENGRSYLRTSSEKKKDVYSIDITDHLDGNPLESGYIKAEYSDSSNVGGLSGMAVSSFDTSRMFMVSDHDEGHTIRLGRVDSEEGTTIELTGSNIKNRYQDWEDLDVADCVDAKKSKCVYISNLGDNGKGRGGIDSASDDKAYNLYYFREASVKNSKKTTVKNIHVKYEDGKGHNSEAMSFFGGKVFVTTKRGDDGKNTVWTGKPSAKKLNLKRKCYLEVDGGTGWQDVTASDIFSYKGKNYFAYRDYENIYIYEGLPK